MNALEAFLREHQRVTRRFFMATGAAAAVAAGGRRPASARDFPAPPLARAIDELESFFTPPDAFRDVSRGKPVPHSLSDARRAEVGLTRDTWQLEVVSDEEHPADIRRPLTRSANSALDFAGLMELASEKAVRFAKVMTCLNIGCPLGTGVWEGVPLRDVFWLTQPRRDVRRIFYHGYHNDDPKQLFRSSLPLDRVLEDPFDLPPVILCYKLNGQWLSPERGGPVRVVVPEAYGFKSIKWLQRIVLTNLHHANDTYAKGNNDVDSRLKSFAATLSVPESVKPGAPIPVTGYAQVGISGVRKVQVSIQPADTPPDADDPYFRNADWQDAHILPPPATWGGQLPDDTIPAGTMGFDAETGRPREWPMRLLKVHWAVLLKGLPAGEYTLRSRTVDDQGHPQPMPRPFRKSGHAAIEEVTIFVEP